MTDDHAGNDAAIVPDPVEPPFHRAARLGDIAELERLLGDVDIDARIDIPTSNALYGITALMLAAGSTDGADVDTIRWLLNHGADLQARSDWGVTAAWYCAGSGGEWGAALPQPDLDFVDRLRILLDAGLDPREAHSNDRSLLIEACRVGDPARVRLLLERGAPPNPSLHLARETQRPTPATEETPFSTRDTHTPSQSDLYPFQIPLFCAAASGSVECVQLLLDAGADLHLLDSRGNPALAQAATPEVVQVLLAAGADAVEQYAEEDVLGRVFGGGGLTDYFGGPERFAVAQELLDAGAPLDTTPFSDWTRLYRAASRHQAEVVDFLLAHGASCRSTSSGTPLHGICWQGEYTDPEPNIACERIIRTLVAAGVPLDALDPQGDTALHNAAGGDWSNETAVRLLLEFGAQPDLINARGHTPLHLAADQGALSCVLALLAAGADSYRPDPDGDTPLDLARERHRRWTDIVVRGGLFSSKEENPGKHLDYETKKVQEASDCVAALLAASRS